MGRALARSGDFGAAREWLLEASRSDPCGMACLFDAAFSLLGERAYNAMDLARERSRKVTLRAVAALRSRHGGG